MRNGIIHPFLLPLPVEDKGGNTLKKKVLTQKILLGLMGAAFASSSMLFVPQASAAPQTVTASVQTDEGASDFSERVQKILDDYHKEKASETRTYRAHKDDVLDEASKAPASYDNASDYTSPKAEAWEPKYNFDWQGTPLANSLYGIAKIAHKDIVVNGDLEGTVYMSLHNVTCREALERVSAAFNLNWMEDGNSFIVSSAENMKQSRTFKIHNIYDMNILKEELKGLGIDDDDIYPNTEQRTVSVSGTAFQLKQAAERLSAIDKPISQCLVLAQLIEVNHGKNLDLGFSYTLPSYSHSGDESSTGDEFHGKWLGKLTFGVTSTANRALNNGHVISRPMIMMMNGQKGKINFGDQVPIMTTTATTGATTTDTEYKDVGTQLTITPSIDEDTGTITMKVDAQVSNISGYQSLGSTKAPQISTRQATTSAHLKSGQSFVIGGLMTKEEMKSLNGIPGLMNLPILGELFRFHNSTHKYGEVYIMLTPYIVTDDINPEELVQTTYKDTTLSEDKAKSEKEAK